jgi:L-asparaginase II
MTYVPLAAVEHDGRVESLHYGAYVALDQGGNLAEHAGDPDHIIFGRSAWKPAQATAMLERGLDLPDEQLAVVCASHSGGPAHLRLVQAILRDAGVNESALANAPDLPLGPSERLAAIAARADPRPLTANCSGKHAGMIATSVRNGWAVQCGAYLDPDHPLQQHICHTIKRLAGPTADTAGRDGCGAPTYTSSLVALARTFRRIATATPESPEAHVHRAMTSHPVHCAGEDRVATDVMLALPRILAKDGAEGVFAAAHPDGRAIAIKIADGSPRAWRPVIAHLLARLGFDMTLFEHAGILGTSSGDRRPLIRVRAV